ncbi:MAG: hypothetical protein V1813_03300 [Candidatus Aenigmatarchaeota archaeon]
MHRYDKVFWMLFVLLEAAIIAGNAWNYTPMGAIMGFLVLAVGFARFGDYMAHKEREVVMRSHESAIEGMKGWLNNQYQLTQGIRDLHDYRLHNMEKRKIELEEKLEKNYRELAGKILDVENRLNLVSRVVIAQRPGPVQEKIVKVVKKVHRRRKHADPFEAAWKTIVEIARKDRKVVTLSRNIRNNVMEASERAIKLQSELTRKERTILKDELRQFWEILRKKGRLNFTKDVEDPKLVRLGSVIVSLLARLPNVEHSLKPRVLYLMGRDTHAPGTLRRRGKRI